MPSLLDQIMQGQRGAGGRARMPSAGEYLRASANSGGILGPPSAPQSPNLFDGPGSIPTPERVQGPAGAAGPGGPQAQPQAQQIQGQPAQGQRPDGSRPRDPRPGERGNSFLARLFTGDLTSQERQALSKEERDQILRQGLLTTGLAMLAGNHSGRSFGEVLSRGIMAARQDATQTAGAFLDEKNTQVRLARRAQVFNNPEMSELEKWREIRRISAKEGDTQAVEAATDIIGNLEELEAGEAEAEIRDVNGRPYQFVQHPDGSVTVKDPFTGETVREAPSAPVDEGERIDRVNQLADDFRTDASGLIEAQRFADNAQGAPATAAGDQTLVVTLNKLLDPNSVVRQSEFARVAKIGGFTGQAQQFANRILSEGELGQQARESIRQEIQRLAEANAQELRSIGEHYRRRALDAGVDPRLVVRSAFVDQPDGSNGDSGSNGSDGRAAPVLFPEDEEEEGGR